jgi:hypothetical protein
MGQESKTNMSKIFIFFAAGVLALLGACQKQQTEAERNAEIERQVNEKLAAEHQANEQRQLAQRQDELDARVKALSEKDRAAAAATSESQQPAESREREASDASPGASYSVFYTKLEPFGAWRETSTYGYVWQPREAMESRSWRPYTNGRWVYTDAGWTWISEEPFGWAAYHYGRWTRLRGIGWVWVPGEEWAPAWVSWRTSNDYVGWAPLPPEARFERRTGIQNWADNYYDIGPEQYCFVPSRDIGSERIEHAVVPTEQNVTIVNQTTNVTNITYNNTTVVNQGPNYDELRTRSQRPVERLRLERTTNVNIGSENPRLVVRGEVVEVPGPVLARAQAVERPPTVKEKVTETVVENGWEGIADNQAAQKARAKMKSEAAPPKNAPPKTFIKPAPIAAQPRVTSRPQSPTASPVARSTITPRPSVPAASAVQTPAAPSFARPAQTVAPTVAASPRATPAPRAPVTAPPLVGKPRPTAAPSRSLTPSATALPVFSPRVLPQQSSPTPSSTLALSPTTRPPPAFGRTGAKEERKAQKEMQKQERAARKNERFQAPAAATPVSSPTASASVSASPSGAPTEIRNKEQKKKHRPGELETSPQMSATPSPSVTPP